MGSHTPGGGVVLMPGLFQVHPGIRTTFSRSHRLTIKFYLAAVFSRSLAGLYMAILSEDREIVLNDRPGLSQTVLHFPMPGDYCLFA